MPQSSAIAGYGTFFSYGNASDGSSTSWTNIAEVVSLTEPEEDTTAIEVSNLQSPNATKEFIPGMIDPGQVDGTMNFTPGAKTALMALRRVKKDFRILFPDALSTSTTSVGSHIVVPGFIIKQGGGDIPTDGKVSSKVVVKCTGPIVFTAAV